MTVTASRWLRPVFGVLAGAGAIAAVALVPQIEVPTIAPEPASVAVSPPSAGQTLVCAGDLLASARDSEAAGSITVAAPQAVTTAGESALDRSELDSDATGTSPLVLRSAPGSEPFAAAGSATVADSDLAGYSAASCRVPLLDSWLVAGAGTTGAADLVMLSNPGEVAATVTLTVYGAGGAEVPPGGGDIVVRPGAQRIIPLAGLALGEESPVVHVQATGAPVAASLQSSITRVLEPGGVDQAGALGELATRQTVVGVTVTEGALGTGTGLAGTIVRVLSPDADTEATISVRAVGAAVPAIDPVNVQLRAGIPAAVEMPSLPVGSYTVDVVASTPVAAAVWQTTGFGAASDFAWYQPSPDIESAAVIAVPSGPGPVLTIANLGAADVAVELAEPGSDPVPVTVPAGASVQVPLRAAASYELTSGGPVRASVGYVGAGALGAFPVFPSTVGQEPIVVYP